MKLSDIDPDSFSLILQYLKLEDVMSLSLTGKAVRFSVYTNEIFWVALWHISFPFGTILHDAPIVYQKSFQQKVHIIGTVSHVS